jgi:hypothetical protein
MFRTRVQVFPAASNRTRPVSASGGYRPFEEHSWSAECRKELQLDRLTGQEGFLPHSAECLPVQGYVT